MRGKEMNEYPPQDNQPPQEPQQPFNDSTQQYPQQQPNTQYPPPQPFPGTPPPPPLYPQPGQYPYQQPVPPGPPPQKPSFFKRKVGCIPMWAVILIVALVGFMAVANANRGASSDNTSGQITATDTPQPTY